MTLSIFFQEKKAFIIRSFLKKDYATGLQSSPFHRQIFRAWKNICLYIPNLASGSDKGLGCYQDNP